MKQLHFDFVIIGSGLAGLVAAYHASKYGRVAIVTKSASSVSNSWEAQGGIAAAFGEDDYPEFHLEDTLIAGRSLCDRDAVEILVNEGLDRMQDLINWGMSFDRENGKILLGLEGGHHHRRIFHSGGDATGKAVTEFMLKRVVQIPEITFFEYTTALKLLIENNECVGVHAFGYEKHESFLLTARSTIMATGGLSRIYNRSTNPYTATGDGVALAWEAGAQLTDMEFVQFHPTALNLPDQDAFLISEAVRGEGAWLLNEKGERFMTDLHPLAELAPRDVVAYAIHKQLEQSDCDHVFLSLRHLDPNKIKKRFSTIYNELLKCNLDLCKDLIPIAPAAHYMMGGVRTDLNGKTNIPRLYACGEVASTGVMGANRLASNSLLECMVFGKRAAEAASEELPSHSVSAQDFTPFLYDQGKESLLLEEKNRIAKIMSRKVGIVRNRKGLEEAVRELQTICQNYEAVASEYNISKISRLAEVSLLVAQSALWREESRGGHIREDFKDEEERFHVHSVQQKNKILSTIPVRK
ncbi:MAG: L-aspartate oxidase [Bacteroidota bacterium]|nr:L-aspartate oxidase [Bacteroidota bacterium]MDP4204973.1 L-aspartate oxidase [Bacteroidota bacterium]